MSAISLRFHSRPRLFQQSVRLNTEDFEVDHPTVYLKYDKKKKGRNKFDGIPKIRQKKKRKNKFEQIHERG